MAELKQEFSLEVAPPPAQNIDIIEPVLGPKEDLVPNSFLPKEDYIAWLQVLGAFCLNLNTWQVNILPYSHPLFVHAANISWIGSTQAFLMFLTSVDAGPIFDTGYYKVLLWAGSILTVLEMFMTSICKEYYQVFLAQGIMMGLGFGLLYLPAPAIVSQFFHFRRGLAIGISSTRNAFGGVIYPIVFTKLQPNIGFGWATRVIASIILASSVPPLLCMKSLSIPKPWRTVLDPTALKDIPYILLNALQVLELELETEIFPGTEIMKDVGTHYFVRSSTGGHPVLVPQPSNNEHDPLNWSRAWKGFAMICATLVTFSQGLGPLALTPMFGDYIKAFDSDLESVVQFTGVAVLVLGFSNFIWVPIQTCYGRRPVMIISTSICFISAIWRAKATSYHSFMGACVLNGLGAGPAETAQPTIIADIILQSIRTFGVMEFQSSSLPGSPKLAIFRLS
ncbi:hypothetical protein BOTCAL_0038g00170 [Botryotinia calthae]|uniref:Major facilitator superfamily (MFS) profile domain-containing protein n=1 Tax=Botryotinia calthae TaxID=38488 RepID=A0A4Y8DC94_9HELO|nr:hypothetical protein BOTCAL_0038g00170 [Botryotinia calthae]